MQPYSTPKKQANKKLPKYNQTFTSYIVNGTRMQKLTVCVQVYNKILEEESS